MCMMMERVGLLREGFGEYKKEDKMTDFILEEKSETLLFLWDLLFSLEDL